MDIDFFSLRKKEKAIAQNDGDNLALCLIKVELYSERMKYNKNAVHHKVANL